MADAQTEFLKLVMPEVTQAFDTWGGSLNSDMQKIDVHAQQVADRADRALKRKDSTVAVPPETEAQEIENRTAEELLFYKDTLAIPADKPHALISQVFLRNMLNIVCPVGTIIQWGLTSAYPDGWSPCDGQIYNGVQTPNLVNRFVMGGGMAGASFGQYVTGGVWQVNHYAATGGVLGHQLIWQEMPIHNHGASDSGHQHSYSRYDDSGANTHHVESPLNQVRNNTSFQTGLGYANITVANNGGNWAHDHPLQVTMDWNKFFPPFIAMIFLMRTKGF